MTIHVILFYILLIDAICANLLAVFGARWYNKHFRTFSRWFPPAKGWAIYYLLLIIWVGYLLYEMGILM